MRSLANSNLSSPIVPPSRGGARKMSSASIAASRYFSHRQLSLPAVACSSSSSPRRRIVSLLAAAAASKRSRSPLVLLGGRTSKSSVLACAVASAPATPTSEKSFLARSAENHAQDDDLELPSFDPSSGLVDLVIAGGGPSGLTVAERVSRAGEN